MWGNYYYIQTEMLPHWPAWTLQIHWPLYGNRLLLILVLDAGHAADYGTS